MRHLKEENTTGVLDPDLYTTVLENFKVVKNSASVPIIEKKILLVGLSWSDIYSNLNLKESEAEWI